MEHKHTPGPWICHETEGGGSFIDHIDAEYVAHRIAFVYSDDAIEHVVTERNQADARLITASPELLAELQHAHQIIINAVAIMTPEQKSAWAQANERDGCDGDGATRYHERADVIAKATGSQP